ncbi:MAG: 1-(5-phosphoribosyl)-5-[(5-phosphoribosylamino)methylideneamino]imidazole-4-carboxamide isomerase [Bacteroidetes bacterium]|nr:1-(5-phosphoribosyl)-5-[(5-phosphoribosylamino)methylideneamino]imidazole-4-carboxamide isomerase [Bacteroidota bacterium]
MEIIPAIDIIAGKCVRLTQGDFQRTTVYPADPVGMAKLFEEAGLKRLHLVDLDGAKSGRIINGKTLRTIAKQTGLTIDFGGGLQTESDVQAAFDYGAAMVSIGSMAVNKPQQFLRALDKYNPDRIILCADVRSGKVAVHGWLDLTDNDLMEFIRCYMESGVKKVICTDIETDGMLAGPSVALYRHLVRDFATLGIIAGGGVSSVKDVISLKDAGVAGVIIGKALYEGRIDINQLKELQNAG